MPEKKPPPKTPFVDKVVKDPKAPPDALVLSGYLGTSSEKGHTRLYLDPQLSDCVEIPDGAILHSQEIPPEASPLGGSYVWIQRDAELIHGSPGGVRSKGTFLEGRIREAYGGVGAQPGVAGPLPTLPTQCGPLSLCPPTCIPVVCRPECETKPDQPQEIPTTPITQCGDGTVCPPTCIPILCDKVPEGRKPEEFPTFPLTRCGPGTACPPTCLPGLCGDAPCLTFIQTCATVPPLCPGLEQAQQAMGFAGAAPAGAAVAGAAFVSVVGCPSVLTACLPSRLVCPTRFFCPSWAVCPTLGGCPTDFVCPSQFACPSQIACPSVLECGGFGQLGAPVAAARAVGAGGLGGFGGGFGGGIVGTVFGDTCIGCPLPPAPTNFGYPTCDFGCPTRIFCTRLITECGPRTLCPPTECGPQTVCPVTACGPTLCPPCPTQGGPPTCGGPRCEIFSAFGCGIAAGQAPAVAARAVGAGGVGGFAAPQLTLPPTESAFGLETCQLYCPSVAICQSVATCGGLQCQVGTVGAGCELGVAQLPPDVMAGGQQAAYLTAQLMTQQATPMCGPTLVAAHTQCPPCLETIVGPFTRCPPTCAGPLCQAVTYDPAQCGLRSQQYVCPTALACGPTIAECGGFRQPATPVMGAAAARYAAPAAYQAAGLQVAQRPHITLLTIPLTQCGPQSICSPCWPTFFGPRTVCPPCPTFGGPRTACPPTCLPPFC